MKKVQIIELPLLKRPELKTVENKIEVFQEIVGGHIEAVAIYENDMGVITIYCNEEGKIQQLTPNFLIVNPNDEQEVLDYLAGNCLLTCYNAQNGETISLNDMLNPKQLELLVGLFSNKILNLKTIYKTLKNYE